MFSNLTAIAVQPTTLLNSMGSPNREGELLLIEIVGVLKVGIF